jgi:hypothetical protein
MNSQAFATGATIRCQEQATMKTTASAPDLIDAGLKYRAAISSSFQANASA